MRARPFVSPYLLRILISLSIAIALAAGLPQEGAIAANGAVTYTYDALGRLTSASYDTGVFIYYTYDANGNRLSQVINVNSGTLTWTATVTPCTANCWGGALW
jgi:YD repeat-containing protein